MIIEGADCSRNGFLQQNAFDAVDCYTTPEQAAAHAARRAFTISIAGWRSSRSRSPIYRIKELAVRTRAAAHALRDSANDQPQRFDELVRTIDAQMDALAQE